MAHTKAKGSTSLGRDSRPKSLGVKVLGGQKAQTGDVIVRQKGTKFRIAENTAYGRDYTIFALKDGIVRFKRKKTLKFNNKLVFATYVGIEVQKK